MKNAKDILAASVSHLELSIRSRKGLQRLGIETIRDLLEVSEEELRSVKNFGETSLIEIRKQLGEYGLMIGQCVSNKKQLPEGNLHSLNIKTLEQIAQLTHCSLRMIVGSEIHAVKNALKSRGLSLADEESIMDERDLNPDSTFWQVSHMLSARLRNVLLSASWSPEMTLKEISEWTPDQLRAIKGVSDASIGELEDILKRARMKLSGVDDPEEQCEEIELNCATLIEDLFDHGMISAKAKNILRELRATTLGQTTQLSNKSLDSVKGYGEVTKAEIKDLLKRAGLRVPPPYGKLNKGEVTKAEIKDLLKRAGLRVPPPCGKLNKPISVLNLSLRASSCLEAARIQTLGSLIKHTGRNLLRWRSFGMTSLNEIRRKLADQGLLLAPEDSAVEDMLISDFELSVRSRNLVRQMNIRTLSDLLKTTEAELLAYKNFGETSLSEIKVMLAQKGLRLGQLCDGHVSEIDRLFDTRFKSEEVLTRKVETTIGPVGEPKLPVSVEVDGGTLVITPDDRQPITLDYEDGRLRLKVLQLSIDIELKIRDSFKFSRRRDISWIAIQ